MRAERNVSQQRHRQQKSMASSQTMIASGLLGFETNAMERGNERRQK